jgi:hypothetical protein
MQNKPFTSFVILIRNVISHVKRRKWIEGVWEQGSDKDIST